MKFQMIILGVISGMCCGAGTGQAAESKAHPRTRVFKVVADQFADIQVCAIKPPRFRPIDSATEKLAYFLTEAGLAGRTFSYDQRVPAQFARPETIEGILRSYKGNNRARITRSFWSMRKGYFSAMASIIITRKIKLDPGFSVSFFRELVSNSDPRNCRLRANQWMNSRGF